ncbi:neoverrucotoxin subunit beta-like [Scyliorhinus canicula]|uniref:neoverrucotoxin subunit beta-like n=1 Tax=Scyliorhinus canicula TaxID=7830 RepID=UPI0018F38060|nr:neoverrucotoxin subunit beta-like [Scyliorhinus canicula]
MAKEARAPATLTVRDYAPTISAVGDFWYDPRAISQDKDVLQQHKAAFTQHKHNCGKIAGSDSNTRGHAYFKAATTPPPFSTDSWRMDSPNFPDLIALSTLCFILTGVTLWDLSELRKNIDVHPKPSTEIQIISSKSVGDKATSLDVEASLKASFLSGMVQVSGSAKYLNNNKTSKQQARVTLNYRATTRFEELTMSQLGPQHITYPSVFDQASATHVVTAVLYGAQAFFVIDRECSSNEKVQEIEGDMEVMVKKIPCLQIDGKGSVKLPDTEKEVVETFSCTFHGDFLLDRNPVSYEEAVQVYSTLPKLLGDQGEKAVPMRVWLYPLTMLDNKAAQIVREISVGLANQCELVFEQFHDIEMRCNDLIKHPSARAFPELKTKVETFRRLCLEYKMVLKQELAKVLPSIRGTGQGEGSLVEILEGKERSPFSLTSLDTWLEKTEKEVNTVDVYLAMLGGVDILSKSQLDRILADPMIEHVVCFTFSSLQDNDTALQELSNYLKTPRNVSERSCPSEGDPSRPSESWFDAASVSERMRKEARLFRQFTESNKSRGKTIDQGSSRIVIASVGDKSCSGASVFLYEEGILVNKEFTLQKPDIPEIRQVTDCSVTLCLKAPEVNAGPVLRFKVGHRRVKDEDWSWENAQSDSESFTVSGLHPHTQYLFRLAPVYKAWVGLLSDPTARVRTLPKASFSENDEIGTTQLSDKTMIINFFDDFEAPSYGIDNIFSTAGYALD